jgi:hypothetical protein
VYPSIIARQRIGEHVPPATNAHTTIELWNVSFSIRSLSYQRKVYVSVCVSLHIVARKQLGKHVPAATNIYATIQELLDALFSIRSVSYERKVGDLFFYFNNGCLLCDFILV